MQVFLNDFAMYGRQEEHLDQLCLYLDRCRQAQLSLNPAKCAFNVSSSALLGHIISREGIAMEPNKLKPILAAPAPTTAKALSRFGRFVGIIECCVTSPTSQRFTRGGTSHVVQMDGNRRKGISGIESHVVTSTSCPTPILDAPVPRVHRCV
mgnify:CR=1 FL=1